MVDIRITVTVEASLNFLFQDSVAVAPTNSQQIASRLPDAPASPACSEQMFGAVAMVYPSLPSTACLFKADAERTNHAEELKFVV